MISEEMECSLCGEEYTDKEFLVEHMSAQHQLKGIALQIPDSETIQKRQTTFKKPVQCEICGFVAKGSSAGQKHMIRKHFDATQITESHTIEHNPETLANEIVTNFENSLKSGGERARKKAIQLLIETNSYMKQSIVEPFSANDMKDLMLETGISQNKTIKLMMKFKHKWEMAIAETDFRTKLVSVLKENANIKASQKSNEQTKTKTGREKKCNICERELRNTQPSSPVGI